jgi:hypothetical protein
MDVVGTVILMDTVSQAGVGQFEVRRTTLAKTPYFMRYDRAVVLPRDNARLEHCGIYQD